MLHFSQLWLVLVFYQLLKGVVDCSSDKKRHKSEGNIFTPTNHSFCLNLYYDNKDVSIPRCEDQLDRCEGKSVLNTQLSVYESKPGFRLIGDPNIGDKFKCYPLCDEDIMRSRSAVRGNLKLIRSLHSRIPRATNNNKIKVVVVGGSVPNGGGCGSYLLKESKRGNFGSCSWAHRFVEWLKKHYHTPHIELISLAQPATTTGWLLSHLHLALVYDPDLFLVDYGVNDAIVSETSEEVQQLQEYRTRAATERLIRGFLKHNSKRKERGKPLAAIMYIGMHRLADNEDENNRRSYSFLDKVYYPVCKAYGVPVVSVRDSVWPSLNDTSRLFLWHTVQGAHPDWAGHQLTTDLLSYAWSEATSDFEKKLDEDENEVNIDRTSLMFKFGESNVACSNPSPPLRSKGDDGTYDSTITFTPIQSKLKHWSWHDHNGKLGWQYTSPSKHSHPPPNLTEHKLVQAPKTEPSQPVIVPPGPKIPEQFKLMELPEIISFRMQFNASSPGLLVDYMKSYEGFGQVVVWVTKDVQEDDSVVGDGGNIKDKLKEEDEVSKTARIALHFAWQNHLLRKFCVDLIQKTSIRKEQMRQKAPARPGGREVCEHIVMGSWDDPSILDGAWEDHSTQIHVSSKNFGMATIFDKGLRLWRVEKFKRPFLFFSNSSQPTTFDDIEDLFKPIPSSSDSSPSSPHLIQGQVHFMVVPWAFEGMVNLQESFKLQLPSFIPWNFNTEKVTKFKILGLSSC